MVCMAELWPTMASRAAEGDGLGHEAVAVDGAPDQLEQLGDFKRLEQVIVGAKFGGLDGGLRGAKRGDENDGQAGPGGVQLAHELQAAQAGHFQIGDDHVEGVLGGAGQALVAALFHGHLVAFVGHQPGERVHNAGIVVDE
jgi:hypothetical protein